MNSRGFSMIELMIVVVIIGILAGIAFPAYNEQMQKSRRTDATTALLALQQLQEKLRSNCNVYGQDLNSGLTVGGNVVSFDCDPGAPATTALRISPNSDQGWYTLSVPVADANGIGYVAWASADAGDRQAGDTNCQTFILTVDANNPNGARTSTDSGGNVSTGCW